MEKIVGIQVVYTVSTRRVTNSTVAVCIVVNMVGNVTQVYCFVFEERTTVLFRTQYLTRYILKC